MKNVRSVDLVKPCVHTLFSTLHLHARSLWKWINYEPVKGLYLPAWNQLNNDYFSFAQARDMWVKLCRGENVKEKNGGDCISVTQPTATVHLTRFRMWLPRKHICTCVWGGCISHHIVITWFCFRVGHTWLQPNPMQLRSRCGIFGTEQSPF